MSNCCWMLSFQVLRSITALGTRTACRVPGLRPPDTCHDPTMIRPLIHGKLPSHSQRFFPCFSHVFPCSKAFCQAPDRFRNLACSTALAPEATDPFLRSRQCPRQPNIARLCQTCHFAVSFVDVEGWKNMALACDTPLELCQFHSVPTVALRSLREKLLPVAINQPISCDIMRPLVA